MINLPKPDTVILVESGTAFFGMSMVKLPLKSDLSLRSMKNASVLYCGTPSGTTNKVRSIASPAIDEVAVTLILIGPAFVGVIRKDTGAPSFDLMSMFFLRDASISTNSNSNDHFGFKNQNLGNYSAFPLLHSMDPRKRILDPDFPELPLPKQHCPCS